MSEFRPGGFNILPPVLKNLIILNCLMFLATIAFQSMGIGLIDILGIHYFDSPEFKPLQLVTHMFMHGGFMHLFFNMFILWMFGAPLENAWGPKRFLFFYFVCGFGSLFLHEMVQAIQVYKITGSIFNDVTIEGSQVLLPSVAGNSIAKLRDLYTIPTVGASGAVYGVLMAFGMLFPNALIYIYFLFPIKAKYLVIILIAIELYSGVAANPGDNVAHFAHLGGMVFGYFLIKYWQKNRSNFY